MKKIILILACFTIILTQTVIYASTDVVDMGEMVTANPDGWLVDGDLGKIEEGILTTSMTNVAYDEKYDDETIVFSGKISDSIKWEYDETLSTQPWIGFALKQNTADKAVWGQNGRAYLIVIKPDVIELQHWVGSQTHHFETVENTFINDNEYHDYQFSAVKKDAGVQVTFIVDGEIVYDWLDNAAYKLTTSGYFNVYNYLTELQIKKFAGEIVEVEDKIGESDESIPDENKQTETVQAETEYTVYPADDVKIIINGKALETDVKPVIVNDRTLVPMRAIFEAMGAEVEWFEAERRVKGTRNGYGVELIIDSVSAIIGTSPTMIDVPPIIVNDRTMVPVRVVSESLNAVVDWDSNTRTVIITSRQ